MKRRRTIHTIGSILFGAIAITSQITAAAAADAARGEQLADRWCAACHAVRPETRQMSDIPPSFRSIAQRPNFDANRLAFFLLNPHPIMPSMSLSRSDAADLAAYIGSLRGK